MATDKLRKVTEEIRPVFVFGISSATWSVMKPLIEKGILPNIKKLIESGASGDLHSLKIKGDKHYRPQVAWPSITTGVLPARHGITKFYHTFDDLKVDSIWDYFIAAGHPVGIYGIPITWPPKPIKGFNVPLAYVRDSKTWPKNLSVITAFEKTQKNNKSVSNLFSAISNLYRLLLLILSFPRNILILWRLVSISFNLLLGRNKAMNNFLFRQAKLELNVTIFSALYKRYKPAYSQFTSFFVDSIQHRYWRYHQPDLFVKEGDMHDESLENAIVDAYRLIDRSLGYILGILPRNAIVAIVSEHGMEVESRSNEFGNWQYLIDPKALQILLGLRKSLEVTSVARWLAIRERENESVSQEVVNSLQAVRIVETGRPLFKVERHGVKEVIVKMNLRKSEFEASNNNFENLHILLGDKQQLHFLDVMKKIGPRRSGMHAEKGILIINGRGIKTDCKIDDAVLPDITPTLLAAAGIKPPDNLDGKILDIFNTDRIQVFQ